MYLFYKINEKKNLRCNQPFPLFLSQEILNQTSLWKTMMPVSKQKQQTFGVMKISGSQVLTFKNMHSVLSPNDSPLTGFSGA